MITEAQELQLRMMELGSFNEFDGRKVAASLRENRHLWKAAVFTRLDSLILLRDLPEYINLDTLYLRPVIGQEEALQSLANTWSADEIYWIGGEKGGKLLGAYSQFYPNEKMILSVWWD